jgi:transposase
MESIILWGYKMLSKHVEDGGNQIEMVALDQLVPEDHLVRKVEQAIDFEFIYDLVKDKYCLDNARPSINPIILIKMVFIQYLFGIRSIRQTIKEIETNVATPPSLNAKVGFVYGLRSP